MDACIPCPRGRRLIRVVRTAAMAIPLGTSFVVFYSAVTYQPRHVASIQVRIHIVACGDTPFSKESVLDLFPCGKSGSPPTRSTKYCRGFPLQPHFVTVDIPPPVTLTFQGLRPSALRMEAALSPNKDRLLLAALLVTIPDRSSPDPVLVIPALSPCFARVGASAKAPETDSSNQSSESTVSSVPAERSMSSSSSSSPSSGPTSDRMILEVPCME